jgi:lipoate-protein ligase A
LSPSPSAGETRCVEFTYPTIEANLALDEALLVDAETHGGGAIVRIWEPSTLAVVLGASSRIREDVDVDLCRRDGIPIARRSSGGGTVLVGPGSLNVTIVLPADAAPGLSAVDTAHRYVLERVARSIREAGQPVQVQGLGDLTLGDRKVSGSAQRRLRRAFFVHLTVLYAFPLELIGRYLHRPSRQPDYRAGRSHADFLTNLDLARPALLQAIQEPWRPLTSSLAVPFSEVEELVATRFGDPTWIERL